MKGLISTFMPKVAAAVLLCATPLLSNAQDADPMIMLQMYPATVPLGGTGQLQVHTANIGVATDIVANSLEITISMGGNGIITGVNTATSDPRWYVYSLSSGAAGNTIKLRNNATLPVFDIHDVWLNVTGTVVMPIWQTITGNISYLLDPPPTNLNPLIGAPSVSQGNMATANDNSTTSLTVTAPLPVTLSAFTAEANECAAQLKWTTTEERNFDRFVVEQSSDARTYRELATVKSKANPEGSEYEYLAEQPTGTVYYRLKMVDGDGQFKYSEVKPVRTACEAATTWSVYPDPARDNEPVHIKLKATDAMKTVNVRVVDVLGRIVISKQYTVSAGENTYLLPALANGSYMVSLIDISGNQIEQAQKLIIAK